MYDLMRKAVGVPVYNLFGQNTGPGTGGSWTVSTHPERVARPETLDLP